MVTPSQANDLSDRLSSVLTGARVSLVSRTGCTNCNCSSTTACPIGTTLVNNACVAEAVCPEQSTLVNGQCLRTASCPPDTTLQPDGTCLSVENKVVNATCPPGTQRSVDNSGRVVCAGVVTCPDGSSWDGSQCVAQITCFRNARLNANGLCVPVSYACPINFVRCAPAGWVGWPGLPCT
jgi:hypothetical protein